MMSMPAQRRSEIELTWAHKKEILLKLCMILYHDPDQAWMSEKEFSKLFYVGGERQWKMLR